MEQNQVVVDIISTDLFSPDTLDLFLILSDHIFKFCDLDVSIFKTFLQIIILTVVCPVCDIKIVKLSDQFVLHSDCLPQLLLCCFKRLIRFPGINGHIDLFLHLLFEVRILYQTADHMSDRLIN